MSEEFLNRADIKAVFHRMRGERVSQRMAARPLGYARLSSRFFDGPLSDRFVHVMPTCAPQTSGLG